ncbi:signal peptidase I [Exilibacterium tricleocarpae]|uniref:Signal peptidase I n=1 Tax=Exilibacterium tricleocarpae TaxID=2591008 RepID=A0A545TS45_9GAMM|nr:signal peptidase I [Exilibacterium tricleocarpae]TQV80044.1 signal peptidase I [Exilibacterium tricleocarpae]
MKTRLYRLLKENRGLLVFIALMLVFRSAIADWNEVPTGSMKPTILAGDRIWVNKMAYDIRVPFTHISLVKRSDPRRGDIVVFDSKVSDKRLVKRVIGLPGDVIGMRNNVLSVNGRAVDYEQISSTDRMERLPGAQHRVRTQASSSPLSSFRSVTVPAQHYLVLGDNRDNSSDSRVIGFIPRHEIVGRTRHVVLSFNYDNFYIPRSDRFLHTL